MVVVYKIDRLTRSLADFARLVERFDKVDCSFVSVTQAFNTSTSMGRLTLNVLLSFAQFEREVTAERIRDKLAASAKRGRSFDLGQENVALNSYRKITSPTQDTRLRKRRASVVGGSYRTATNPLRCGCLRENHERFGVCIARVLLLVVSLSAVGFRGRV